MPAVREQPITVTTRTRGAGLEVPLLSAPDRSPEELAALVEPETRPLLGGGEPTLRADLPQVIAAVAAVSPPLLRTDGLALGEQAAVRPLLSAGLTGARIALHSGRRDAHDWLVSTPGAARRATRAMRTCVGLGLALEVEIVATRPTIGHLAETVALARRLGARAARIRMLHPDRVPRDARVALVPRVALLREALEEADRVEGIAVEFEGFPRCCSGGAAERLLPSERVAEARCEACPGPPACPGLCSGYVALFGGAELGDRETAA